MTIQRQKKEPEGGLRKLVAEVIEGRPRTMIAVEQV